MLPPAKPLRPDPASIWRCKQPTREQPLTGRLAGPLVAAWTHLEKQESGQRWSKPCRLWATTGVIACRDPRCLATRRFIAYVPVITKSERIVCIISATEWRFAQAIAVGEVVEVIAGARARMRTRVMHLREPGYALLEQLPPVTAPADISEYLLRVVWRDLALWRWLASGYTRASGGRMPAELESEPASITTPIPAETNHAPRNPEAADDRLPLPADLTAGIGPTPHGAAERNGHRRGRK